MSESFLAVKHAGSIIPTNRTVLIIDGSYVRIGARHLPGQKIDYLKFRRVLENLVRIDFSECWFFDQEPISHKNSHQGLSSHFTALKRAPPDGPQFQLMLYAMKKYNCRCKRCGHSFHQLVQKGVDNGIATKILSLAYENICDRILLVAGDGDFYDSLNLIKNILRKDLWVAGYRNTMSADLQQLASRVVWINDIWHDIQRYEDLGHLNGVSPRRTKRGRDYEALSRPKRARIVHISGQTGNDCIILSSDDEEIQNDTKDDATGHPEARFQRDNPRTAITMLRTSDMSCSDEELFSNEKMSQSMKRREVVDLVGDSDEG